MINKYKIDKNNKDYSLLVLDILQSIICNMNTNDLVNQHNGNMFETSLLDLYPIFAETKNKTRYLRDFDYRFLKLRVFRINY
jgi:hypothetical protein